MNDKISSIVWTASNFPIIGLMARSTELASKPLVVKFFELVVVGAVSAASALWANDIRQDEHFKRQDMVINQLIASQQELKNAFEEMRHDFYRPLNGLNNSKQVGKWKVK